MSRAPCFSRDEPSIAFFARNKNTIIKKRFKIIHAKVGFAAPFVKR
jgi:hypothetical protein